MTIDIPAMRSRRVGVGESVDNCSFVIPASGLRVELQTVGHGPIGCHTIGNHKRQCGLD